MSNSKVSLAAIATFILAAAGTFAAQSSSDPDDTCDLNNPESSCNLATEPPVCCTVIQDAGEYQQGDQIFGVYTD